MRASADFSPPHKRRQIARGQKLILNTIIPTRFTSQLYSRARLGIIVPKRFVKRAVTRNTIKRVIRESFRATQSQLKLADYVVYLNSSIEHSSITKLKRLIRAEIDMHFRRAIPGTVH